MAPRPTPRARSAAPVIVAGALRTASGLGESTRISHDALKVSALPVFGIDLSAGLMQPLDRPDFTFEDGSILEGPGTIIMHVNSPLMPLALWRLGRHVARNKYIVGYWAWELPVVPRDWQFGVPFVHEIWAPSVFTANALRGIAGDKPVRVVSHPVACRKLTAAPRFPRPNRPFTALLIFDMASSFARKNPIASIMAFRRAFGDDASVRLIIKAANSHVFPIGRELMKAAIGSAQNVVLVDRIMSTAEIDALYSESDVILSLHRSEGFGLTLAEAMVRGLPVVATNWSGSIDFVTTDVGFPIPYRMVPATDPQGIYHHPSMEWADPDVDAAADAMRRLRCDPTLRRRLGAAGAAYAAQTWNAETYASTIRRSLALRDGTF